MTNKRVSNGHLEQIATKETKGGKRVLYIFSFSKASLFLIRTLPKIF